MLNDGVRKSRILCVLRLLEEYSSQTTPLSAAKLIELLSKNGISAERKAIYRDIEEINNTLCEVIYSASDPKGYYLAKRKFEEPEVCLLIDAVQSAGFIPKNQTKELVGKLEGLMGVKYKETIGNRICIENRSKGENNKIYEIIGCLNEAISAQKKVKLKYCKNVLNSTKIDRSVKELIISPYALLWDADHYYLIGNNAKYDNLIHLRIDRIDEVVVLPEKRRHFNEVSEYMQRFDVADYARKTFNMFGGELKRIDLECNVKLLDQITDRFGSGIFIRHDVGSEFFRFSTDALISEGLIGWLMQFGGNIRVLSPKSLKESVIERAAELLKATDI